ncbi:NADPH-dependent FMN reductase [Spirosoma endbachense]|uniref:NADPH-dependent FMN reductase-like domain-containing protein n=1 Tax=Spirosoma endbachense TaxID=2666025 RepID=A0A6P1VS92_9BACT|nr:NADPH-dependent FMN reductase [Spirosoma endbachense]QHV94226.1 hypothetical protein GJR95_03915 [Spirosoma endbachense]
MKILAISGSLRLNSTNTKLLRAIVQLAPTDVEINLYDKLGAIPPFNLDLDNENALAAVADFRSELQAADAIVVCSPEYAHGVSGVLKNALDWIVSSGEFMNKPVGIINASPRSLYAHNALIETLTVMMAIIIPEASPAVPVAGRSLDEAGILADQELATSLLNAIDALVNFTEKSDH